MTWTNDRWTLLVLGAVLGCSSGSGAAGSTGSMGSATCGEVCQAGIDKGCATNSLAICTQECEQSMADYPAECRGGALALSLCAVNALGCNFMSGEQIFSACPSQSSSYIGCSACAPDPADDDACDVCSKQSCCSQRKAVYGDPNLIPYGECLSACGDLTCIEGCSSQYPSITTTAEALTSCESGSCATECQ